MWRFLLIALVALLFGLAMFAINHEPLNSPLTWILAPLAGAAALGFLIRMFGYPRGGHGGFIRILTPRTNGEHPLAQRRRRPAAKFLAKDEARRIAANIAKAAYATTFSQRKG
jgi:hypothetical protein